MTDSVNAVSARTAARSHIFAAAGRAAKAKNVDRDQLLGVFAKRFEDVPEGMRSAWLMSHRIYENYRKPARKASEGTAEPVAPASQASFSANA